MFTLPSLSFEYDALEPHIDAETMEIHHTKHHQGYTDKLNAALEGQENLLKMTIEEILKDASLLPESIRQAVINNGGGFYNHTLFWSVLSPENSEPAGTFKEALLSKYGSLVDFRVKFEQAAASQFGSGWTWLVVDKNGELEIMSTANQDCPLSIGKTPILTLDVWEHAYYLNYQNRRPDYISAFWNIVNWAEVEKRYMEVVS